MPKYQCPECETILKRETPVAEGKKIKCPKCEVVFKPIPMREAGAEQANVKTKAKAAKKSAPADDEDDDASYGMAKEPDEEGTDKKKKKKEVDYGSLRDKFEKSTRGPAMARLVRLSNGMLFIGVLTVVFAAVGIMFGLWPFIFSEESPKGADARSQLFIILGAVLGGAYGGCMCYGASKMNELESYRWSMTGAIMTSIFGIAVCITAVILLVGALTALNTDPNEVDALLPEVKPPSKTIRGKATQVTIQQLVIETSEKKTLTMYLSPDIKIYKKNKNKPGESKNLREGVSVWVAYVESGDTNTVKDVVVNPPSNEDDSLMYYFLMLVYLGVLAWGAFVSTVGGKSFTRLKQDDIKDGFEETQEAVEY